VKTIEIVIPISGERNVLFSAAATQLKCSATRQVENKEEGESATGQVKNEEEEGENFSQGWRNISLINF
jgi:hypothetical protein